MPFLAVRVRLILVRKPHCIATGVNRTGGSPENLRVGCDLSKAHIHTEVLVLLPCQAAAGWQARAALSVG